MTRWLPKTTNGQRIWLLAFIDGLQRAWPRPYLEWLARHVLELGNKKREALLRAMMLGDFAQATDPGQNHPALAVFRHPFNATMSVRSATEASRQWHGKVSRASTKRPKVDYPPVWLPSGTVGDIEILPIQDSHALADEGRRMKNCVASAELHIVEGHRCIYSVLRNGNYVATLELYRNLDGEIEIGQLFEAGNKQPCPEVKKAVQVWFARDVRPEPKESDDDG